jgi:hypothetical protein
MVLMLECLSAVVAVTAAAAAVDTTEELAKILIQARVSVKHQHLLCSLLHAYCAQQNLTCCVQ